MPLKEGSSREVVGENIKTEMEHGKPQPQAVAIALKEAGLSKNHDDVPEYRRSGEEPGKGAFKDADYIQVETGLTLEELQRRNEEYWRQSQNIPLQPDVNKVRQT